MVGAGAPHATFVDLDFLRGHMPRVAELNTGFYQAAQLGTADPIEVPFVSRWAHDVALLQQWGYNPTANDRGSEVAPEEVGPEEA